MSLHVSIVTRDPETRERASRAFDEAPPEWVVTLDAAPPEGADVIVTGKDVDVPGDVAYEPGADLVAAVRSAAPPTGRIIRVGGLPGSGRTSVALHLAAALGRTRSTCLVDLDPGGGAGHRMLIDDPYRFVPGDDVHRAAVPVGGGFRLITASSADATAVAEATFDLTVVDGDTVALCDVVLLQPTVPQVRRLREMLGDARPRAIAFNRMGRGGGATRRELERLLGRRIAVELPHAPALRDAEDAGRLIPTWTRWWARVAGLGRGLVA